MPDLDPDALTITSWEEYSRACLKAGETWRFRKKLSDHIWFTNKVVEADLKAYAVGRMGEWAREDLADVIRRKKLLTEMKMEWRMLQREITDVMLRQSIKILRKYYLTLCPQISTCI